MFWGISGRKQSPFELVARLLTVVIVQHGNSHRHPSGKEKKAISGRTLLRIAG
jgi:hypothetical protein